MSNQVVKVVKTKLGRAEQPRGGEPALVWLRLIKRLEAVLQWPPLALEKARAQWAASLAFSKIWLAAACLLALLTQAAFAQAPYQVKPAHPRLLIDDVEVMAARCQGPLRQDYEVVKERADAAVRRNGIEFLSNPWSVPEDLMNCGLAYLVERQEGHECRKYADVIIKEFGDGRPISDPKGKPLRLPGAGL